MTRSKYYYAGSAEELKSVFTTLSKQRIVKLEEQEGQAAPAKKRTDAVSFSSMSPEEIRNVMTNLDPEQRRALIQAFTGFDPTQGMAPGGMAADPFAAMAMAAPVPGMGMTN